MAQQQLLVFERLQLVQALVAVLLEKLDLVAERLAS
jgi:hypothetical protein